MTETVVATWLVELVRLLAGPGPADEAEERALDALLAEGLELGPAAFVGLDAELLRSAASLLVDARTSMAAEITAVHRQRIDVDRTVRAITAYVRALA